MRQVGHIGHRNPSTAPRPRDGVRSHAWMKATKPPRSRLRPRTVGGAPAPMEPPRPVRWGSGFFPGPGPSATTPIPPASQTPGQTYKLPRKRAPHPVCLSWQMPHPSAIVIQAFKPLCSAGPRRSHPSPGSAAPSFLSPEPPAILS